MKYPQSFVQRMLNLTDILIPILTVAGLLIAAHQWAGHLKRNRIDHFRMNLDSVKGHREGFSTRMRELYLKDLSSNDTIDRDSYNLAKRDWIMDSPKDLGELKVNIVPGIKELNKVSSNDLKDNKISYRKTLPDRSEGYTENVRRYTDKKLFNGPAYRLVSADFSEGKMELNIQETTYYDYYDTCERLLYQAVCDINRGYQKKEKADFVCRLNKPFDFESRVVGIGVSTLTIIKNLEGKNYFLIHKRSGKVAEATNTVSAVPAGTLEHLGKDKMNGSGMILCNIVREFEEELLGVQEVENAEYYPMDRVDLNGFEFKFLGMGLDPLTTKLEFMSCMVIDANVSKLFSDGFKGIFSDIMKGSYEGSIHMVEFTKENLELHMHNRNAMPLFRDMMRIVGRSFDEF